MVPPDARAFLSTVDFTKLLIGTIDKLCVEGMAIADFSMGMLRTQLDAGGDSRVFDCLVTDAAVSEGVPAFGGGVAWLGAPFRPEDFRRETRAMVREPPATSMKGSLM